MSITTVKLSGKKNTKDGSEMAWKVNAKNLEASKYPNLTSGEIPGPNKTRIAVAQVPMLPSNVTTTEATSYEDVVTEAGDKFQAWVVRSRNEQVRNAAEAAAKAYARDIESYADGQVLTYDGTGVDIYTVVEKAAVKQSAGAFKSELQKILELDLSDAERIAMIQQLSK
jgi:hypothetical protein